MRFAPKVSQRKKFPVQLSMQKYIISINGILAFCSYVIMDSQKPILGWYYSSKTYIHAIWIHFFNKLLRKTQISLGIRPVWSEFLLCAQWVAKGSVLLQADSEDSDQTGRMHRLIWVFAGRTVKIHGNRNRGYMEGTYRQHIFMILYQMKELKTYSLPRRYKTMSENA